LAGAAAIVMAAFYWLAAEPAASNRSLHRAVESMKAATPGVRESIADAFLRADAYATTGRYQVREEFANYAIALAKSGNVPLSEKAETAQKAVRLLQKSILEDPGDARHYMYASTLTNGVVETVKLLDASLAKSLAERNLHWLDKAESLGPNRPRISLERAQSFLALGRGDEAVAAIRKAIALDPLNKDYRMDLIAACISSGRYEEAEKERLEMKRSSLHMYEPDYERLAGLYVGKKQFAPVIALYRELLQEMPNDASVLARLATAYREAGDLDSARKTAEKAAAVSPQAAAQLQEFLKTLAK
jgi:tetratricopeptide (TPR) repeat protein